MYKYVHEKKLLTNVERCRWKPQLLDKLQDEGDNKKRQHGFEYLMTNDYRND